MREALGPVSSRAVPAPDALLDAADYQSRTEFPDKPVTVAERFRKVVPGVDMHERKRDPRRPERLAREPRHHNRILPPGKKQPRVLKLRRRLAQHENRLSLKLVDMAYVVAVHRLDDRIVG